MARKKVKRGLSRRSLLFFAPFFFLARLDFPCPQYLPLGLQGWVTLGAMFFLTRHAILKPETIQKIQVSHKRHLWPERAMAVYAFNKTWLPPKYVNWQVLKSFRQETCVTPLPWQGLHCESPGYNNRVLIFGRTTLCVLWNFHLPESVLQQSQGQEDHKLLCKGHLNLDDKGKCSPLYCDSYNPAFHRVCLHPLTLASIQLWRHYHYRPCIQHSLNIQEIIKRENENYF